jgi:hypothetical protein
MVESIRTGLKTGIFVLAIPHPHHTVYVINSHGNNLISVPLCISRRMSYLHTASQNVSLKYMCDVRGVTEYKYLSMCKACNFDQSQPQAVLHLGI